MELVKKHTILRTLFPSQSNRILQVVLRNLSPNFIEQDASGPNLQQSAEAYCRQDCNSQGLYGEPLLAFTLMRSDDSRHLLIIRLSHAQYDGLSIPKLMGSLLDLYHQQPISVQADFAMYTRHCTRSCNAESFSFWRRLLQDSSMTSLSSQTHRWKVSDDSSQSSLVESTMLVSLPDPPPGITLATLVKTAWALAQSILLQQTDLVFGQLVSGRNSGISKLEDVIGPCVNIIPVRVQARPGLAVVDLLREVQAQHVETMPFETVGLKEIVQNCTTWPSGTDFGSIVHHRYAEDQVAFQSNKLLCRVDAWSPISLPAMNVWASTIAQGNRLKIEMYCRSDLASKAEIDRFIEGMSSALSMCCEDISVPS